MGFNWEDILGADGDDIQTAYDEAVSKARMYAEGQFNFSRKSTWEDEDYPCDGLREGSCIAEENTLDIPLSAYLQTGAGLAESCRQMANQLVCILEDIWKLDSELPFPTAPEPSVQEKLSALYGSFFRSALSIAAENGGTFRDLVEMVDSDTLEGQAEYVHQSGQALQELFPACKYPSNFNLEIRMVLERFLDEEPPAEHSET